MLEDNTVREKIIAAAFRLAAEKGWSGLTLDDIAAEAEVSLRELRQEFCGKPQILAAYIRMIDDKVLEKIRPAAPGDTPHDRLFDVIMTRFETQEPYKRGLKRILRDLPFEPGAAAFQILPTLSSQYWMLAAAGVNAGGIGGALRLPGAAAAYAGAYRVWLEDDEPGLARTMAALDKRLRRGERLSRRCEDICDASRRLVRALLPGGYGDHDAASRGEGERKAAGPETTTPAAAV